MPGCVAFVESRRSLCTGAIYGTGTKAGLVLPKRPRKRMVNFSKSYFLYFIKVNSAYLHRGGQQWCQSVVLANLGHLCVHVDQGIKFLWLEQLLQEVKVHVLLAGQTFCLLQRGHQFRKHCGNGGLGDFHWFRAIQGTNFNNLFITHQVLGNCPWLQSFMCIKARTKCSLSSWGKVLIRMSLEGNQNRNRLSHNYENIIVRVN